MKLSKANAALIRSQIIRAREDVRLVLESTAMWATVTVRGEVQVATYLHELQKHLVKIGGVGATVSVHKTSERSCEVEYPRPYEAARRIPVETHQDDFTKDCPKCGATISTPGFVPSWPIIDPVRGPGMRVEVGHVNDVEFELHVTTCEKGKK